MKKILFVIGSLQIGGAETVLVDLVNNIYKEFDITVLLIEKRGELLNLIDPKVKIKYITKGSEFCKNIIEKIYNKIKLSLIFRYLGFKKYFVKRVYNKILKETYDKEIAYLPGIPSEIVSRSPNEKSTKLSWIHCDISNADKNGYARYQNICDSFDSIIGVSQASIDSFKKIFPQSADKITLLYNYMDLSKIHKKALSEKIDFKNNKINIVSVGRLNKEKGFDRILKVAKKYEDKVVFNIIGGGQLENELKSNIISNDIKNVNLLGLKSNPYPYIKAADVFLLSSRTEAYPTVLIEALVLNKYIVATNVSGVKEILKNYKNKIIIPNEDDSIELAIDNFIKDGIKNYEQENVWDKTNEENLNKIKKVLKG